MLVTLICEDHLYDVVLPEKVRGKFWIEDAKDKLLSIEEQLGIWTIHANHKMKLYEFGNKQAVDQLQLQSGKMYVVEWNTGKKGYMPPWICTVLGRRWFRINEKKRRL